VALLQSEAVVSTREDIAAIEVRIGKAESERDSWRRAGQQEKYLEAYSMVEALELQLDRLRACALPALLRSSTVKPPDEDA
jgi:hypothetical protein